MSCKKIALIGMMGSGKTTISKLLAQKIPFSLYDLDMMFCEKHKTEIKDYFKKFGEENFRINETKLLKEVIKNESFILSCGGGIILKEENRNILFNSEIFTIYLKTTPENIYERIKTDTTRPLLQVQDPKSELEKILFEREKFYKKATVTIENKYTPNKTAEEIFELWKNLK